MEIPILLYLIFFTNTTIIPLNFILWDRINFLYLNLEPKIGWLNFPPLGVGLWEQGTFKGLIILISFKYNSLMGRNYYSNFIIYLS